MTKKPKTPAWNSFTKAELIRTVKKLDKRQTQLLNELEAFKGVATALQLALQKSEQDRKLGQIAAIKAVFADNTNSAFGDDGVALNSAEHPDTSDCLISEDALETVEVEVKPPAEQTGFVVTKRMPWETTDEGSGP